jgi:formate hydrogenlyase subunit 4
MLKLILYVSLIAVVFAPWGLAIADASPADRMLGAIVYLTKLAAAGIALGAFETSISKMRVFRVPDFVGAALMLGFLGALLLFVSRTLK